MDPKEKELARSVAYVFGAGLTVVSAIGLGAILEGPVGACTVAGAIGATLLWLGSRSGLKTPPRAGSEENKPAPRGPLTFYTDNLSPEEYLQRHKGQ